MSFGIPVRNGLGLGLTPSTMLSSGQPGGRPALLLNFVGTTSLDSRITFSRTSNATLVDSTGALTYAPNNQNTYSEQFDNAAWGKTAATITANAITAPNGSATADKLVEDLTTAGHYAGQSFSAVAGYSYVFSAYAKAGERTFLQLVLAAIGSPTTNAVSCFDLVNGTVTSNTGGQTAAITPVGNGWYRCSIALKSASTATTNTQLRLSTTSTTAAASYTGDGTSGAYIWGAQFEQATYQTTPSTYNSTTPANLVGYTQEFDNAAWTKTAATITANAATAPDGTLSADKIIATAVSTTHSAGQNLTVISGTTFTGSVYAKAGEYNFAAVLLLTTFAAAQIVICDLSNGTIASSSGSPLATSVTDVGNGWYRISITQVTNAAGTATMQVRPSNVGTTTAFTGDGTSGVYIWGAQLSNSGSIDPYVYNPAAALTSTAYYGPRFDYDPANLTTKGLLIEEQRTNLLTYSSQADLWSLGNGTVTANATVAPDGTLSADAFIENTAATVFHYAAPAVFTKAAAAVQYATSFYLKDKGRQVVIGLQSQPGTSGVQGRVDPATGTVTSAATTFGTGWTAGTLTMTDVGGGWYRAVLTATSDTTATAYAQIALANGATVSYTGDGVSGVYVWGAQVETGAFATSYIPTAAAQVTRSADVAQMLGDNFANWFSASAGAFTFNGDSAYGSGGFIGSTPTTGAILYANTNASRTFNGTNFITSANTYTNNVVFSTALGYSSAGRSIVLNGGTVATDANLIQTPTAITLGGAFGGGYLNGHIRSITYYPQRLPDATLQALTS